MRLLIEAHHPAHIHFFKEAIREWRREGVEVRLLGRDRDVMRRLLEAYDFIPSVVVSSAATDNRFPLREMLRRQAEVARQIRSFRPDLVLSLMGSYTQSAALFGVPNLVFTDSEFQHFNHRIAHPFASCIYTPRCFWKQLGPKQRRYPGYHELAFLHPERFSPNPGVLERLNHQAGEYVVVRTSAWNTLHDIGARGLGDMLDPFLNEILQRAPLWIVPEGGALPARWQPHRLSVAPEDFHDVLAFARLVVTEGASTASEAACLGVPAVYINTTRRGYLDEQERRYGLVHNFSDPQAARARTLALLDDPPSPAALERAHERLIADHIDVTGFVKREVARWAAG